MLQQLKAPAVPSDTRANVLSHLRWRCWAAGKIPWLLAMGAFILLQHPLERSDGQMRLLLFLAFASACSVVGFLINDLSDANLDAAAGKSNAYNKLGSRIFLIVLLGFAFISLLLLPGICSPWFTLGSLLWFALTWAYSMPPLRLKERSALGLVAVLIAQFTIPAILLCQVLSVDDLCTVAALAAISTICGASVEIAHQIHDYETDRLSQLQTFAVTIGYERACTLMRILVLLSVVCIGAFLELSVHRLLLVFDHGNQESVILSVVTVMYALVIIKIQRALFTQHLNPYYSRQSNSANWALDRIPHLLLPTMLLSTLAYVDPRWALTLCMFIFWRVIGGKLAH